jgi:hypothetical protein
MRGARVFVFLEGVAGIHAFFSSAFVTYLFRRQGVFSDRQVPFEESLPGKAGDLKALLN